ncbi:hypothetical protein Hanom_Chr15g01393551 [Helianthus anomalus]
MRTGIFVCFIVLVRVFRIGLLSVVVNGDGWWFLGGREIGGGSKVFRWSL